MPHMNMMRVAITGIRSTSTRQGLKVFRCAATCIIPCIDYRKLMSLGVHKDGGRGIKYCVILATYVLFDTSSIQIITWRYQKTSNTKLMVLLLLLPPVTPRRLSWLVVLQLLAHRPLSRADSGPSGRGRAAQHLVTDTHIYYARTQLVYILTLLLLLEWLSLPLRVDWYLEAEDRKALGAPPFSSLVPMRPSSIAPVRRRCPM